MSVIVPVALAVAIDVPADALLSVTVNVSFASLTVSPVTETANVWLVVPAANVSVPETAV